MNCCSWLLFAVWVQHFLRLCMTLAQPVWMLLCPPAQLCLFAPTQLQLNYTFGQNILRTPTAVKIKPKHEPKPEGISGKGLTPPLKKRKKSIETALRKTQRCREFFRQNGVNWLNVGNCHTWRPSGSLCRVSCFQSSDLLRCFCRGNKYTGEGGGVKQNAHNNVLFDCTACFSLRSVFLQQPSLITSSSYLASETWKKNEYRWGCVADVETKSDGAKRSQQVIS